MTSGWIPAKNMQLLSGGEALNTELAERLISTGATLWNMYGPTETTVWSSMVQIDSSKSISIGQPIANTQIYILDKLHQLVPIGVTGELCIAGDGLARGYINRSQLTAERFITLSGQQLGLEHDQPVRLYKTGDLAQWQTNGYIKYFGRVDHQVKLRGFRIELGEIEAILQQQENIKQAAVIVREDRPGIKHLVAYLTFDTSTASDIQSLRQNLSQSLSTQLPEYMVPNLFITMETMPLNYSGKLDRNALPVPTTADYSLITKKSNKPLTSLEKRLTILWQEILGLDEAPGVYDDFLALGGNSLLAVRLIHSIETKFKIHFPVDTSARFTSISELAKNLNQQISNPTIGKTSSKKPKRIDEKHYQKFLTFHAGRTYSKVSPESLLMDLNVDAKGSLLYLCGAFQLASAMAQHRIIAMDTGHGVMSETKSNVHNLAAHYVEEIIEHRLPAPAAIIGYSQGAWVALEMAQLLLNLGHKVPLLCQIDYPGDQAYAGKIAHFITNDGDFKQLPDSSKWQQDCKQFYPEGVTIDRILGDHNTIVNQGGSIQLLEDRIEARLQQLNKHVIALTSDALKPA